VEFMTFWGTSSHEKKSVIEVLNAGQKERFHELSRARSFSPRGRVW